MSERTPRPIAEAARWTVENIAERFEQMPFPAHDIAHGTGEQIGAPADRFDSYLLHRAEFYPDAGVVRVTTPDVRIELFRAAPPQRRDDGVLIENESGTSRLIFRRDGHVAVEVSPAPTLALPDSPLTGDKPPDEDFPASSSQTIPGASDDAKTASQEVSETV